MDDKCEIFSHETNWGVDIDNSTFSMPSSNNKAISFKDFQYFELMTDYAKNKYEKFCEGDIYSHIEDDEKMYYEIIFSEGQFALNNSNMCKAMDVSLLVFCKKEGNIFQNKYLLNYREIG